MRLSVCIAALACLALASRVAAVSELDMHSLPVETTLLETGETVLAGCWREAKRLCFEQKARCRTECNRIEDELTKGSEESSGSASASSGSSFLQLQMRRAGVLESAPTEIVPRLGTAGAKACPGNKCSSLYQSCYKVHSEACGFRKNDHIKWSSLKDVNSQAEAHRAKCVKKLRNVCRKSRIRCEKECAEDKADSKATGGTEEDACDPAKCKNQYVACREAMQVNEQSNCLQSLVKPQQVPGLFECRDPENCKTPWEKPKAGCADDACAQGASVSGVSSCEGCDKARILCYDECGGKIDGSCDIAKRDCQKEHRQCHYTCPWKKALSIPQADTAGKGGKPLVRAPLKGSQKNCGCLGNDEQCLKKSPCYDPNSVTPVTVPRGSLPQPGLWGQTNGLMASSVKAGKARRDEDRAAAAQAKKETDARVDRLKKWRKQRAQDRKALDKLKTSAQRAADRLRRRHNRHVRRNNTPKGLKTLKQRKPKTGKKNKASKKATGKKARFSQQGDDEAEEQPESEEAPQQEAPQPEAAPSEESQ